MTYERAASLERGDLVRRNGTGDVCTVERIEKSDVVWIYLRDEPGAFTHTQVTCERMQSRSATTE